MQGKIVIELALDHTAETGSGLPDIGHVAYELRKHIDGYEWTAKKSGKVWKLREHWSVVSLTAQAYEEGALVQQPQGTQDRPGA